MIHTSRQLKDLIKNKTQGNSEKSQIMLRCYMMERFLERLSVSEYSKNFILKGGMLISSMVGIDARSTMDIDATLKNMPLSAETTENIISQIISINFDDGIEFNVKSISEIMDEAEYGGIRVSLNAMLDTMRIPLKIDISTGDVITPREVEYGMKLMFEDRKIEVLAYNLETLLAEKAETIITRSTANTRLRDFYDIYILQNSDSYCIDYENFTAALNATCKKRGTAEILKDAKLIIKEIEQDTHMQELWTAYQNKFDYVRGISWDTVISAIENLLFGKEKQLK